MVLDIATCIDDAAGTTLSVCISSRTCGPSDHGGDVTELIVDTRQKAVASRRELGGLLLVRQLYRPPITVLLSHLLLDWLIHRLILSVTRFVFRSSIINRPDLLFHQNSAAKIRAIPTTGPLTAPAIQALLADACSGDDDKVDVEASTLESVGVALVRLGEDVLVVAELGDVVDAGSSRYTGFASHPVRQA